MFPGAGASIDYNEAGEVIGWDYPAEPEYIPYEDQEQDYDDEEDYEPTFSVIMVEGEWVVQERDDGLGEYESAHAAECEIAYRS